MRYELGFYFTWHHEFRPHQGIKGITPVELYSGISHAPPKINIRDPNTTESSYRLFVPA